MNVTLDTDMMYGMRIITINWAMTVVIVTVFDVMV